MAEPRHTGEAIKLTARGQATAAVIGPEATDARAIWHDIQAAARAAVKDGTIPHGELTAGLRAIAVATGGRMLMWLSPSPRLSTRLRKAAADRATAALRGHRAPLALPVLSPRWRAVLSTGTLAVAAAVTVLALLPSGAPRSAAGGLVPGPPAAPASGHRHRAGRRDAAVRYHPPPGPGLAAAAHRPARRHSVSVPSPPVTPGHTSTPTPGPSSQPPSPLPTQTSAPPVPVPSPTATVHVKVCIEWLLGACIRWKLVAGA